LPDDESNLMPLPLHNRKVCRDVCGTGNPRAAPGERRHIAGLFPHGRYAEFQGARHLPNVEQPEAFNRALLEWLETPTARRKSNLDDPSGDIRSVKESG
jgi:hypothetical protein